MSKHALDQNETTGYFLPENSHFRLKKLHEHMVFLSQLALPRRHDEEQEWVPEIRVGELAICLELLAEQAERVLEETTWPARREAGDQPAQVRPEADAQEDTAQAGEALEVGAPEAEVQEEDVYEAGAGAGVAEAEDRFVFGLTLEQADELDRLHNLIYAHGDVIFSAEHGDLAVGTLSSVGHAVFDDAIAARAIMEQVASQRLRGAPGPRHRVREEPAIYAVPVSPGLTGEAALPMLPSPTSPAWPQASLTRH